MNSPWLVIEKPARSSVGARGERWASTPSIWAMTSVRRGPPTRPARAAPAQPQVVALAVRVREEGPQRAGVLADVRRQHPVDQHDAGVGRAREASPGPLGPRERRAVRVGRVGAGEHADLGPLARLTQRTQALVGAGQGELGPAEPVDEVAAAQLARRLHRPEHRVHRREAPRHVLGLQRLTGQYAVAIEQRPRQRGGPRRRRRRVTGPVGHVDRAWRLRPVLRDLSRRTCPPGHLPRAWRLRPVLRDLSHQTCPGDHLPRAGLL